jgi:hypothetical protein
MGGLLHMYRSHNLDCTSADLEGDDQDVLTPPSSPCEAQGGNTSLHFLQKSGSRERNFFEDRQSERPEPHSQLQECKASASESDSVSGTLPDEPLNATFHYSQIPQSQASYSSSTFSSILIHHPEQILSMAVDSSKGLIQYPNALGNAKISCPQGFLRHNRQPLSRKYPKSRFSQYDSQVLQYVLHPSPDATRGLNYSRYALQGVQDQGSFVIKANRAMADSCTFEQGGKLPPYEGSYMGARMALGGRCSDSSAGITKTGMFVPSEASGKG